jgi:TM2 domain-containing membrane protein YozV
MISRASTLPISVSGKSNARRSAALLSMLWPGLGQIYNGAALKGVVLLAASSTVAFVAFVSIFFGVAAQFPTLYISGLAGGVAALLIWVFSIVGAYKSAKRISKGDAPYRTDPITATALSFVLCGLGQIYNREAAKGVGLIAGFALCALGAGILQTGGEIASVFGAVGTVLAGAHAVNTAPAWLESLSGVGLLGRGIGGVLSLALVLLWVLGMVDAYRTASRGS